MADAMPSFHITHMLSQFTPVHLIRMYAGDSIKHGYSTILKGIVELGAHKKIRGMVDMKTPNINFKGVATGFGAALGSVATPLLTQASIATAGFGAGGIVSGTPAAALMASYGGSVGSGSACAILQSVGAAGLGVGGIAVAAGAGGFLAYKCTRSLV
ncbi:hypothetical protein PGTUg99_011500 [Puccinia graminis f. sp. tritici]|uniref:Uncharacterized protein n=1 Tax=Puccinia graminis f. sp. tritici TaxID=56615 RepID=A0A5B0MRH6_PUCGR|nr:hypothetical protein PGTUg99_011500 [Puccinia graminis f. sp. tritici]